MRRPKLSATVISFNEEDRIEDCLRSLSWVDEILVVDSLSTDRTVEICESLGARVHLQKFLGHVQQKNLAVELARHDWVLGVDADERVSPELARSIQKELASVPACVAGFSFARRNHLLGSSVRWGGWYPDRKLRLFDRRRGRWTGRNPHDRVLLEGESRELKGDLLHFPYRSLDDHLMTIHSYTRIMAEAMAREGKRPSFFRLVFHPVVKFLRAYLLKLGFLDGRRGFLLAALASYYNFLKYARLWASSLQVDHEKKRSEHRSHLDGGAG